MPEIIVQTTDETFFLDVELIATVEHVKSEIQNKTSIASEKQRLYFAGVELYDVLHAI